MSVETVAPVEQGEVMNAADFADRYPELASMIRAMDARVKLDESLGGGNDFVHDVMESILSATNWDDIFAAQESGNMPSGQDFVHIPFLISDRSNMDLVRSTKGTGSNAFPFYYRLRVVELNTGAEQTIACGGKTFVTTLWALTERGFFDDQPSEGRALVIIPVPSPAGAYLTVKPFKRPEQSGGRKPSK